MTRTSRVALALLVAAALLGTISIAPGPARAASPSFALYGSVLSGWGLTSTSETNPGPALTVSQGDSVTITLHSTDGLSHQFLVDYNGNGVADPGEPVSSVFNTSTVLTFTASQAGTFHYLCTIHGSAMMGTFTVQGSGAATPTPSSGSILLLVGIGIGVLAVVGISVLVLWSRR